MEQRVVLAYDLGTSGVKGAVVNTKGEVLAAETASYPLHIPREGWAEQDPEDYWQAVCQVTARVMARSGAAAEQVTGLAFGTMWRGIIPIDAQGRVLHNSILWLDRRARAQADQLNAHFGTNSFFPADYWSKLLWLRENRPEVIDQAHLILETNSYLKWRATGQACTDISNNFGHSPDPVRDAWLERVYEFIGVPRDKLPEWAPSYQTTGTLTPQAAKELGLLPGTPVFAGSNDIQAVTVGAGCSQVGGVHVYFGSSGWVGLTVAHKPGACPGSNFDMERDVAMAGMKAIGLSLNWAVRTLYREEWERLGDGVFDLVNRDAAQVPPGSEGLLATPWLYGETGPGSTAVARGCFLNLGPDHSRGHMIRAVMEGVCFQLKQRTLAFCSRSGTPWPDVLHAVGGGACSEVWMQILADVMGIPVRVPCSPRHAGALGVACTALIGLGEFSDYADVADKLPLWRSYEPRKEFEPVYRRNYHVFDQLFTLLDPVFEQLSAKGER